jgi:hypothetical protein
LNLAVSELNVAANRDRCASVDEDRAAKASAATAARLGRIISPYTTATCARSTDDSGGEHGTAATAAEATGPASASIRAAATAAKATSTGFAIDRAAAAAEGSTVTAQRCRRRSGCTATACTKAAVSTVASKTTNATFAGQAAAATAAATDCV